MNRPAQPVKSLATDRSPEPLGFMALCELAFAGSVAATAYFCRSMSCEMNMPGGWTMSTMCPEREAGFRLGCKRGATCCACCFAPMLLLVVLGMMNPFVIIGVAAVIAAEKILPRPGLIARLVGIIPIVAGVLITIHKLNFNLSNHRHLFRMPFIKRFYQISYARNLP